MLILSAIMFKKKITAFIIKRDLITGGNILKRLPPEE